MLKPLKVFVTASVLLPNLQQFKKIKGADSSSRVGTAHPTIAIAFPYFWKKPIEGRKPS
jgi:hypothetical protein